MLKKNVQTLRQKYILLLILLFTLASCNQKASFAESSSAAAQGAGKSSVNDQTTTTTNGTTGKSSDISGAELFKPSGLVYGIPSYEYDTNHIEQIFVVNSSSIPYKMTQKGFPKDYKIGDMVQCPLNVKFNGFSYKVKSADFEPLLMSSDSCDRHAPGGIGQLLSAFSTVCNVRANIPCDVPQPISGQLHFTGWGLLEGYIQLNTVESCAQDPTHAGNVISNVKPGINMVKCFYELDSIAQ